MHLFEIRMGKHVFLFSHIHSQYALGELIINNVVLCDFLPVAISRVCSSFLCVCVHVKSTETMKHIIFNNLKLYK